MRFLLRNPHARPPRGGDARLTDGNPAGAILRDALFNERGIPGQAALYFVIYPSAQTAPNAHQIVAGQNASGAAARASGWEFARPTVGEQVFAATAGGLAAGTSYRVALVWFDSTWFSNVVVSAPFTTAAAGSTFFRTNVGGITIVGTIRRTSRVRRLGSLTLSGIVRRFARVRCFGSLTAAGVARKLTRRRLLGSSTLAGLVRKLTRTREVGSLTPVGALRRFTRKVLSGSLSLSAVLAAIKQGGAQTYQRAVGGTIALAGLVRKRSTRRLASAISAAGAVRKRSTRRLSSTVAGITGSLRKFSRARVLSGSLTPSGLLSDRYVALRLVTGTLTVAGQVRKLTRRRLVAAITAAGALRKLTRRRLLGAITAVGLVRKRIRRRLTATIVASGTTIRRFSFRVIAASVITVSSTLARLYSPAAPPEPFSQRLTHLRRFIGRR